MKPLGHKAYGSIPHLPGSKLGEGDHHCHEGQARILTEKTRDKHDLIIVQEKYDGSNVAIAKKDGQILALTRSGYLASTSPFEQHHYFAKWVEKNKGLFFGLLLEGERISGEWLLQAHGTRYLIVGDPFVAFDMFDRQHRFLYDEFIERIAGNLKTPTLIHCANNPITTDAAMRKATFGHSRDCEIMCLQPEGVVYRVERKGKVDFLAKYVRNDFVPGVFLPEISGKEVVWNCNPESL